MTGLPKQIKNPQPLVGDFVFLGSATINHTLVFYRAFLHAFPSLILWLPFSFPFLHLLTLTYY
jgi:hypothetical protein